MPDFIKPIIEVLSKTYLFPLSFAIVFWIFNFFPSLTQDIEFRTNIFWVISGWIFTIYSIIFPISKLKPYFKKYIKDYFENRSLKKKVRHIEETIKNSLTVEEKEILKEYILKDVRALNFRYSDGTIGHLCHLGILYRGSSLAKLGDNFDYVIQDFVVAYLKKNPNVLD